VSQTVQRALAVLDRLGESPCGLGEVAADLGVHKSTALRLLQALTAGGFARRLPDGRYTVGFGLIALGQRALDGLELHAAAHPHLLALGERLEHTLHLGQLIDDDVVYVDKIDGQGAVRMYSRIGRPLPLHASAIGKVVLAHLPAPARERLMRRVTYEAFTPGTITTDEGLRAALAEVAARGWAEDAGEFEDYANSVAVPVFDRRGQVCAGLSLTALRALAGLDVLRDHLPALRDTAAEISRDLGWTGR
jgi:DNA-binding IclR family transcriptional regulator